MKANSECLSNYGYLSNEKFCQPLHKDKVSDTHESHTLWRGRKETNDEDSDTLREFVEGLSSRNPAPMVGQSFH